MVPTKRIDSPKAVIESHAGSSLDSRVTLTFDLLNSGSMYAQCRPYNAFLAVYTNFVSDSSSLLSFLAWIHTHTDTGIQTYNVTDTSIVKSN